MNKRGTKWISGLATVSALFVLPACGTSTDGTPVTDTAAATTTSDLVPLIDPNQTTTTSTAEFRSVQQIITDVKGYWITSQGMTKLLDVSVVPSDNLTCDAGESYYKNATAVYCGKSNTLTYDRSRIDTLMMQPDGELATEIVFAHEIGHALADIGNSPVQPGGKNADVPLGDGVAASELSADCFSGLYISTLDESQADITAALKLTALASPPARKEAFNYGYSLNGATPKRCLTQYGG